MALLERTVLQCTTGGSNKFYEINIETSATPKISNYTLRARWGRIENFKNGSTQSEIKSGGDILSDLELMASSIISSKIKRGYKVVSKTNNSDLIETFLPKKKVKATSKKKKVAKKQEEPITEWYNSNDYNIVEREV